MTTPSIPWPSPDRLRQALAAHTWVEHGPLPGRTNHRRAGVLVPLHWTPGGLNCVVTLRAAHLNRHRGEVSFPGGRPEPDDLDLTATALREAREELGLHEARVLGRLSSTPVYTSEFRLEPFVAEIQPHEAGWQPDPGEVAEVLELDLGAILEAGTYETVAIPTGHVKMYEMPVYRPGGWVMFGATSLVLTELLGVLAAAVGRPAPVGVRGGLQFEELLAHGAAAGRQRA
jgi:8-oxo-dGTP pyrophosphatase MutT (NUDIX family)